MSIFSEETPGHDGAMIIENNRIKKFGVHLPLTEDVRNLGKFHGFAPSGGIPPRAFPAVGRARLLFREKRGASISRAGWCMGTLRERRRSSMKSLSVFCSVFFRSRERMLRLLPHWLWRNTGLFGLSLVLAAGTWLLFAPGFRAGAKGFHRAARVPERADWDISWKTLLPAPRGSHARGPGFGLQRIESAGYSMFR